MKKVYCLEVSYDKIHWMRWSVQNKKEIYQSLFALKLFKFKRKNIIYVSNKTKLSELI